MDPNFSSILDQVSGDALPPMLLPAGIYKGIIRSAPTYAETQKNKLPYAEFQILLTDWPEEVAETDRGQTDKAGNFVPEDLKTRNMRWKLFFSHFVAGQGDYRVDRTLKTFGITLGRSYKEALSDLTGQTDVNVKVSQYTGKRGLGNQIDDVYGNVEVADDDDVTTTQG